MNRRELIELLAAHADELIGLRAPSGKNLDRNQRVQSLLNLAEEVQGILVPVQPDVDYRRRLHGELILRAQSQAAEPDRVWLQQHRKGILIGAAALGSVASVVGVVVAFWLYLRHGRAANTAAG
jgi:hypothetical protein